MTPHWLVFGDGGRYFYTSNHMSGLVTALNAHNNSIAKEIQVGQTPHGESHLARRQSPGGHELHR